MCSVVLWCLLAGVLASVPLGKLACTARIGKTAGHVWDRCAANRGAGAYRPLMAAEVVMSRFIPSLLAVLAVLSCLILPGRGTASTAFGWALFPEGSVGQKLIYMDFSTPRSWERANELAADHFGTSLASILSAEEQSAETFRAL